MKKNDFNTEKVLERLNKAIGYLIMEGYLKTSTQKELAEKMKKNNATNVNYALNGDSRYLTEGFISTFNKAFDSKFNLNWLLNGEPPMLVSGNNDQSVIAGGNVTMTKSNNRTTEIPAREITAKAVKPYLRENLVNVPYVPVDAKASFVESLYDTVYEMDTYGVMPEEGEDLTLEDYVVFQIKGDSMLPLQDGTKVLAKKIPEEKWEEASGVVFAVYGKTLTVKRILKNSLFQGNVLTLKADNQAYGQMDIERGEIRGMWQAIRIVSQRIV